MFREMYGNVYEICRNMEKVMGMFSEELNEMDRNTVQYMIDEMQETINAQTAALEAEKKSQIKMQELINAQAATLEAALKRIEELESKIPADSEK